MARPTDTSTNRSILTGSSSLWPPCWSQGPPTACGSRTGRRRWSHQFSDDGQKYDDRCSVAGKFGETGHETRHQHHSCSGRDLGQRLEMASDPDGQPRLLPNATRWRSRVKLQHNQTRLNQAEQAGAVLECKAPYFLVEAHESVCSWSRC